MATKNIDKKVFEMKVIQSDWENRVRGKPCRIIEIPDNFSLYRFAEAITDSFGFYFDHPFGFYDNPRNMYESKEGYELFYDLGVESEFKGVEKTKMKTVFKEPERKWLFLFDYGDDWHFLVQKLGESPFDSKIKYPRVVRSELAALPQYPDFDDE